MANCDDLTTLRRVDNCEDIELDLRSGFAKGLTNTLASKSIKDQPVGASLVVNFTAEMVKQGQSFKRDATLLLPSGSVPRCIKLWSMNLQFRRSS